MKIVYIATEVPDDFEPEEVYLAIQPKGKSHDHLRPFPGILLPAGDPYGYEVRYPECIPVITVVQLPNFVRGESNKKSIELTVARQFDEHATFLPLFCAPVGAPIEPNTPEDAAAKVAKILGEKAAH